MRGYDDIIVRDTIQELVTGTSYRSGTSVDIIPYGQEILTWRGAKDNYGSILYDPESAIITERTCNCYIRGLNIASEKTTSGTARMFLMPFNVFTNPQVWYSLTSYDSHTGKTTFSVPMISARNGNISREIAPYEVCINENAFLLNDSYHLEIGEHYCLCAVVDTPDHPIQIPSSFRCNLDVDRWVMDNPNVSLLNVRPVDMNVKQTSYSFSFGNFNPAKGDFALTLKFGCNYKKGEVWSGDLPVRIQCTDSRCLFDYTNLRIQSHQPGKLYQGITVEIKNVPANFYGKCNVYIDNVVPLPQHGFVNMTYYQLGNEIPREYASERHRFLPLKGGNGYALRLGSCDVYNSDMSIQDYYQLAEEQANENIESIQL